MITNKLTIENCEAWLAYNPLGPDTLIQRAFEQLADIMRENEQLRKMLVLSQNGTLQPQGGVNQVATHKDRDNG